MNVCGQREGEERSFQVGKSLNQDVEARMLKIHSEIHRIVGWQKRKTETKVALVERKEMALPNQRG